MGWHNGQVREKEKESTSETTAEVGREGVTGSKGLTSPKALVTTYVGIQQSNLRPLPYLVRAHDLVNQGLRVLVRGDEGSFQHIQINRLSRKRNAESRTRV